METSIMRYVWIIGYILWLCWDNGNRMQTTIIGDMTPAASVLLAEVLGPSLQSTTWASKVRGTGDSAVCSALALQKNVIEAVLVC